MDPKEFENIIREADQSREKSLILLICASKSLVGLESEFENARFNDEQSDQLNQLLDCVDNIIDLWLTKLNKNEIKEEELIELIEESDLLGVLVNLFYRNLTVKFIKIEQILDKLFSSLPLAKDNQAPFYLFLMENVQRFKQEAGKEKFTISEKLNSYLNRNLAFCLQCDKVKNCIKIIAELIYNILQNRLAEELRLPIFKLLSTITINYNNLDWFIKCGDERRSFLLVSRLACIESRMCLEAKFNDLNLLTSSLIILEYSIKILIETDDELDGKSDQKSDKKLDNKPKETESNKGTQKKVMDCLTNDDIIQLIDAIKLLMESILAYLKENQDFLTDNSKATDQQCVACLRVLCLYLTFENKFLSEKFEEIINLIAKFILNELPKSDKNLNLINLCLTTLISIMDDDPKRYKDQLVKLGLIDKLNCQTKNCKGEDEWNVFKSFLDSII